METKNKLYLKKKYSELRDQIVQSLQTSGCEVDVDGDIVDKLQGQSLINTQNSLLKAKATKLHMIELALDKLDRDEYGDCEECGEPIGLKRLEALPGINVCICCAEMFERK